LPEAVHALGADADAPLGLVEDMLRQAIGPRGGEHRARRLRAGREP
jgi:hypothetical protein